MVLESTVILMDSSEYQRNGDYFPSRLLVQKDGINLVCQTKLRANPENEVGLMLASTPCQMLCTLMTDQGIIFSRLHAVNAKGNLQLLTGIRIAHLALKHRHAKHHKIRIVAFVGSPLEELDANEFRALARRLKKEKVNVDFISFGEHKQNEPLLLEFIDILNGKNAEANASHLLVVPRGVDLIKVLLESPIIRAENGVSAMTTEAYEFGFDPDNDPELAFALRISMEEERQRHELPALPREPTVDIPPNILTTDEIALQQTLNSPPYFPNFQQMTEEEQIAFAMRMSMQGFNDDNITDEELEDQTTPPARKPNDQK